MTTNRRRRGEPIVRDLWRPYSYRRRSPANCFVVEAGSTAKSRNHNVFSCSLLVVECSFVCEKGLLMNSLRDVMQEVGQSALQLGTLAFLFINQFRGE